MQSCRQAGQGASYSSRSPQTSPDSRPWLIEGHPHGLQQRAHTKKANSSRLGTISSHATMSRRNAALLFDRRTPFFSFNISEVTSRLRSFLFGIYLRNAKGVSLEASQIYPKKPPHMRRPPWLQFTIRSQKAQDLHGIQNGLIVGIGLLHQSRGCQHRRGPRR